MKKQTSALCHELPTFKVQETEGDLWLPLIPIGQVTGRDGRTWNNHNPELVIERTKLPFILDIDHQSELSTNTAASGWIVELAIEGNHIKGRLELNDLGKTAIENKHYKFYSPAFLYDTAGNITKLVSVGLTNKPNLDVPALNHTQDNLENPKEQNVKQIAEKLGLNATANTDEICTAINALQTKASQAPDLNSFVPKATYDQTEMALNAANAKLAQIEKDKHNAAVELALNSAIKAKKIAPADKDYYQAQCATEDGLKAFNAFIEKKAPLIGDVALPDNPPQSDSVALNSEQKKILSQLGLTEKDLQGE
ncbi:MULTISPECIES: phage protease [Pasteurellaceae]|uniref:Phage protease n=1 Tax=Pasteurella atlantica TaxID=2827233 RepID=A0AAW8CMT2_9PAST|nr:phage protease [Pasteurella atlantica]MBR0573690.1 hypothetical protein [Pasteurella atlantica]MDP8039677.1 phage protease [Pasteurella atlantica]MDP8041768.1 phage protease [Pasteurella atlantica]MDP8043958.1 phage protease [Pasteurella atlantica]MDP8045936.1 phage protease [Pasteurella atlantica]